MPHLADIRTQVDQLVDNRLRATPFFRVDSTVKGTARSPIISVYIDGDNGISIDDCADISRDLHREIDHSSMCPSGFELNVSSPGLDRSLRLPRQYARHVGRDVRLEVKNDETSQTIEGRLVGTENDMVRVEGSEGEVKLSLGSIQKAVVKAAW